MSRIIVRVIYLPMVAMVLNCLRRIMGSCVFAVAAVLATRTEEPDRQGTEGGAGCRAWPCLR